MTVSLPREMADLPKDKHGRPIPWFVDTLADGSRDFRIVNAKAPFVATRDDLCWICGNERPQHAAFVIGPMCTINRNSAEPPSHLACATYAARMCPFLSRPNMVRRSTGLPEEMIAPAGLSLARNPGVAAVWQSRNWQPYVAQAGGRGLLFDIGDPTSVSWWAEGRSATGDEVRASIDSGLPSLEALLEPDDKRGRVQLRHMRRKVEGMLPA